MISYSTIQEMIDGGYTITLHCDHHHHHVLDLQKLGNWLGFDHSTLHKDLSHKLWCPVCDSRDVSLTISPPTGMDGGNPMAQSSNSYRKAKDGQ